MQLSRPRIPTKLLIVIGVLFILGIAAGQYINATMTEEQLMDNVFINAVPFVLIFAAIILTFIAVIYVVASMLDNNISTRAHRFIEQILIVGIVLGVVGMFQPWVFEGYKYAFFSPEQDPPDDFYDDLIHIYVGQNTQHGFANQMPEQEYIKGMDFIKDHFYYIYPENDSPTPEYINARFVEVIKKHKIDGCVIDPYNQLDNDIKKNGGREDLYLSAFLSKQKRLAQQYDIFMVIIAHPKGSLTKTTHGDYEKPNVYDLAGGAMWSNKCDNVLCTYRPYYTSDFTKRDVQFTSQKIKKQKLCGIPGTVELIFKLSSLRYYEMSGQVELPNPLDKTPEMKNFYEVDKEFEFNDKEAPF